MVCVCSEPSHSQDQHCPEIANPHACANNTPTYHTPRHGMPTRTLKTMTRPKHSSLPSICRKRTPRAETRHVFRSQPRVGNGGPLDPYPSHARLLTPPPLARYRADFPDTHKSRSHPSASSAKITWARSATDTDYSLGPTGPRATTPHPRGSPSRPPGKARRGSWSGTKISARNTTRSLCTSLGAWRPLSP
jgi:hypothetical protein